MIYESILVHHIILAGNNPCRSSTRSRFSTYFFSNKERNFVLLFKLKTTYSNSRNAFSISKFINNSLVMT